MKKFVMQPEFTNHCNFKCIFCPHSAYRKKSEAGNQFNREKGYMSRKLFDLFLENAEKYARCIRIGFFGEQMLHPKFEEYIRYFPVNRNYVVELNTNWSLVTEKNIDILKRFDLVLISLDASYSSLWKKLCPGGPVLNLYGKLSQDRYNTIVHKIYHWLSLPDHAPTRIVYVVSSINKHDRRRFVKKWCPILGPKDEILTKSVLSYGGVMKDDHIKKNKCKVPSENRFTVAWNGDCTPCNLDINIELNVGNLLEVKDMKKIIEGGKWKQTMSDIQKRRGICSNCFDANNWTENKLYYKKMKIKDRLRNINILREANIRFRNLARNLSLK